MNYPPSDSEILDWIEQQVKKSRTGISFDKVQSCEGELGGFRFMRYHHISEPRKTIRDAVIREIAEEMGLA